MVSLTSGPKHGHALSLDIAEYAGVRLGPGSLYGAITRLEERGLIEALPADDRRRPYRLTEAGQAEVSEAVHSLARVVDTGRARLRAMSPGMAPA